MGLDIADVDNDGWPDIYTTDMLPEDEYRLKTTASFEGWDIYQAKVTNGYHHQFMRNMLQRNNGNGTFSDVGQMAGVARTDWSWSALIADLDLDGHKDIFVTNGIAKDVTSQDYIAFLANEQTMKSATKGKRGGLQGADQGDELDAASRTTRSATTAISRSRTRPRRGASTTPSFSNGAPTAIWMAMARSIWW